MTTKQFKESIKEVLYSVSQLGQDGDFSSDWYEEQIESSFAHIQFLFENTRMVLTEKIKNDDPL